MEKKGFEVTYIDVDSSGRVDVKSIEDNIRDETFLVSIMQANNETGIRQPLDDICKSLEGHPCYFHVDAAQGFGKDIEILQNKRIDLISASSHKIYGPKGIGILSTRRRGYEKVPLTPLMFGGGQERGLRPGTLPVSLIAGFGKAVELAKKNHSTRKAKCLDIKKNAINAFNKLDVKYSGDQDHCMEHVLNLSFGDMNSEAVIVCLKDLVAISNGSACTSSSYTPSHVLTAMGMSEEEANRCIRISWCHLTDEISWDEIASRLSSMMQ